MVQVYSSKATTILKGNTTVAYPVHILLLRFTKDFQSFLIDNWYTIIGLLPVSVFESAAKIRVDDTAEDCDGKCWEAIVPFMEDLHPTAKYMEKK